MVHVPKLYLVKIGISRNVKNRAANITESMPGRAVPIFALPIIGAMSLEKYIHRQCAPLNRPFVGSGRTEWFYLPAAVVALGIMLIAFLVQLAALACVGYVVWLYIGNPESLNL